MVCDYGEATALKLAYIWLCNKAFLVNILKTLTHAENLIHVYPRNTHAEDQRTWSEFRPATSQELTEAEKAMNKLKTLIGYCKPYDKHCQNAIHEMEKCLSGVEKLTGAL